MIIYLFFPLCDSGAEVWANRQALTGSGRTRSIILRKDTRDADPSETASICKADRDPSWYPLDVCYNPAI